MRRSTKTTGVSWNPTCDPLRQEARLLRKPLIAYLRRLKQCQQPLHDVKVQTKLRLVNALVVAVFLYGSQLWPGTSAFRRRVDVSFTKMLRYCTHSYDVRSCYNDGKIPHLSSLICFRKITTVGHALRRQQALSFLLTNPETRKGRSHTLEKELASYIPVPQSDWDLLAQDRDSWRKMAVQKAYESEEAIYLQLNKSRAKRWADIGRLQSRTFLRNTALALRFAQHGLLFPKAFLQSATSKCI